MWLFGSLFALLSGLLLMAVIVGVIVLATVGVTVWAIVDACRHSEEAWSRTGQSRPLWVVLLAGGWLVTGIGGLVLALVYLFAVRPRLVASERAAAAMPRPRGQPQLRHALVPEHLRLAQRASDADRDDASAWLRHHYSVGRLTYDELLQRLDEAYAARTVADLERSLRDLPQW